MARFFDVQKLNSIPSILLNARINVFDRPIWIFRRRFASDRISSQATTPPLKFSETAAFGPRRIDRAYPTAKPLTFWEDMHSKQGSYFVLNRMSFLCSTVVFMVYFCILRQENDLDEELDKPLWQRLPSLEEQVLHERIILGKHKGDDVSKYEERYNELQKMKKEEQERLLRKKR